MFFPRGYDMQQVMAAIQRANDFMAMYNQIMQGREDIVHRFPGTGSRQPGVPFNTPPPYGQQQMQPPMQRPQVNQSPPPPWASGQLSPQGFSQRPARSGNAGNMPMLSNPFSRRQSGY